tara:strand:+ start:174 stop:1256 length:1083 start_codon:yes stop_codon:yes gene_type:complete
MAIKYLAGERIIGTAAERAALTVSASPTQNSWKVLDSTVQPSNATTIEVTSVDKKDNIMILGSLLKSSTGDLTLSTGDSSFPSSGSNYSDLRIENGGSWVGTSARTTNAIIADIQSNTPQFTVGTMSNRANKEKLGIWTTVYGMTAGSGSGGETQSAKTMTKDSHTGSNQMSRYRFNSGSNINADSEMIILGCDDDEGSSGTNFWTELAEKTLTSTGTLDTGTWTGTKKYLWVDAWFKGTSTSSIGNVSCQFNGETSGYTHRYKAGVGDHVPQHSQSGIRVHDDSGNDDDGYFVRMYILNRPDTEKLVWSRSVQISDGNIIRAESSGKYASNDQITRINLAVGGTCAIGSCIKVWGGELP